MTGMRKNLYVLSVCLIGLTLIGGCAAKRSPVNWKHPTLDKELWAEETGYCRRHARRETDLEAGLTATGPTSSNLPGGFSRHRATMSQYQLQQFHARTFDNCMKRRGFVPIAK